MNTQVCTATKKTPYELVFGQEPHEIDVPESESAPTSPYVMSTHYEEFRKAAAENVEKNVERMRAVVESRKRQITFSVGKLVRISRN